MESVKDIVSDHPVLTTGAVALGVTTAVGFGLWYTKKNDVPGDNVPVDTPVNYHVYKIGDNVTIDGKLGVLEKDLTVKFADNSSMGWDQVQEKLTVGDTQFAKNITVPIIAPNTEIFMKNNSELVKYIINNSADPKIDLKNVTSVTVRSYFGNATNESAALRDRLAVYEVKFKSPNPKDNATTNVTSKTILGVGFEGFLDKADNGKIDNSFATETIKHEGKIGALEDVVKLIPDKYTGTFATLKQWANATYGVQATEKTNATELLNAVNTAINSRITENYTAGVTEGAKAVAENYTKFVGNTVKWNSKYGNFTDVNATAKSITATNINTQLPILTGKLNGIMTQYVASLQTGTGNNVTDAKEALNGWYNWAKFTTNNETGLAPALTAINSIKTAEDVTTQLPTINETINAVVNNYVATKETAAGDSNFKTAAQQVAKEYIDFTGNTVKWNSKYSADFTAANATKANITKASIGTDLPALTNKLNTILKDYITTGGVNGNTVADAKQALTAWRSWAESLTGNVSGLAPVQTAIDGINTWGELNSTIPSIQNTINNVIGDYTNKAAITAGTQNFTKAVNSVQAYVDFVGNTVGWDAKYANFAAINGTVGALKYTDIAAKLPGITTQLKTALTTYINDQKADAISGAKSGIEAKAQDSLYRMLWNATASDLSAGLTGTELANKFGVSNYDAMQDLEFMLGKVNGMQTNVLQNEYLTQTGVNVKDLYLNGTKDTVATLEKKAESYASWANDFKTNMTSDMIFNETGNARMKELSALKTIGKDFAWLSENYNINLTMPVIQAISNNDTYGNTTLGKALAGLYGNGAAKAEIYMTNDGLFVQGYTASGALVTKDLPAYGLKYGGAMDKNGTDFKLFETFKN